MISKRRTPTNTLPTNHHSIKFNTHRCFISIVSAILESVSAVARERRREKEGNRVTSQFLLREVYVATTATITATTNFP